MQRLPETDEAIVNYESDTASKPQEGLGLTNPLGVAIYLPTFVCLNKLAYAISFGVCADIGRDMRNECLPSQCPPGTNYCT